jgi:hypothetical protein
MTDKVHLTLTVDEARHAGLMLRASVSEMDDNLRAAWESLPAGTAAAKLIAAADRVAPQEGEGDVLMPFLEEHENE